MEEAPRPFGQFFKCHPDRDKLWVIVVVSNAVRYKSRIHLYEKFRRKIDSKHAQVVVVETAFGHRPFEITDHHNPYHVQLRSWSELWHKENMINLGLARLAHIAPDWKYVAWIDADVEFVNDDWVEETIQQLQHYQFVQMWQNAIDIGPSGEMIATHFSFMNQYLQNKPYCYGTKKALYHERWHPGYAWAARREAIDHVGGLLDIAILGAGDNHMAHALIGKIDISVAAGLHPNYAKHLNTWQERSERHIRRNVGVVPGTIIHYWHGRKKDRRYHDRWRILVEHQYNPDYDLKRDHQGLYQLADHGNVRSIQLRDSIRAYFRSRNEDSIDVE